jgi:hypothetical protein
MNYFPILALSFLFLFSCSQETNDESNGVEVPALVKKSSNSNEVTENESVDKNSFYVRAKFVKFWLGDAEHYSFEEESGEIITFDGCEIDNFDFTVELDESESDTQNQGWGSNPKLQGKWFKLTYVNEEQPMYIDGPMGMTNIINKAVLEEE